MNEKESDNRKLKVVENIRENYQSLEGMISKQLFMGNELHGPTTGSFREEIWAGLFGQILPKKFVIEQSAFIIDSEEGISKEIDLVIMDEMYTPYIFRYGKLKFIPIEAVAAVVECKSQSIDERSVKEWGAEIKKLRTAKESVARLANMITKGPTGTQLSTNKNLEKTYIKVLSNTAFTNLYEWFKALNFYEVNEADMEEHIDKSRSRIDKAELEKIKMDEYQVLDKESRPISLMTFNFQLNQLLMLINNPMLFPHRAYVKLFSKD